MDVRQIHVMAAAIRDGTGRVLVARRPAKAHQGGLWEFPGGKLEPGETPELGLARELAEELGIEVSASRPLIRVHHDYGDRRVLLDVRWVDGYRGQPRGLEGQPLAWLHPDAMDPTRFPAADRPIIMALRLPQVLFIAEPGPGDPADCLARLQTALTGGARLVQLRAPGLEPGADSALAAAAVQMCAAAGARLLLDQASAAIADCPCHGIHLSPRQLALMEQRPGPAGGLVGASCPDGDALARAADLGLDYAVLGPVKSGRRPQTQPLGWARFFRLVDLVPLPVYARGGLTLADLPTALEHGAQGIAASRDLWPG